MAKIIKKDYTGTIAKIGQVRSNLFDSAVCMMQFLLIKFKKSIYFLFFFNISFHYLLN